jgi:hypothetical protein
MIKQILSLSVTLAWVSLSYLASAQSYAIQRGHGNDDLYIYCRKNATANSVMQMYYLGEHGKTISVQYTIPYPSTDNDLNLRNFVADPTPGMLFCTSLNNAVASIYQSVDYGKNWQQLGTVFSGLTPPIALLGGSVAGEIIMTERLSVQNYGIGSTTDFFATHMLNAQYSTYFAKAEIGINSGEIYGIDNAFASNKDFVLHSADFGVTITSKAVDSAIIYNPSGQQAQKVCHGSVPGEIFLVTLEPGQAGFPHVYRIYRSLDYGTTYSFRNEFRFDLSSSYTDFTGGRTDCSFYVVNWKFDQQLQRQIMQVYYSHDCGLTFTLYEHDLDEFVNIAEPEAKGVNALNVSPNPAITQAMVSCTLATPMTISVEVYNSLGKCISKSAEELQQPGKFAKTLDLEGKPAGLYTVQIMGNGELVSSGKLLIAK